MEKLLSSSSFNDLFGANKSLKTVDKLYTFRIQYKYTKSIQKGCDYLAQTFRRSKIVNFVRKEIDKVESFKRMMGDDISIDLVDKLNVRIELIESLIKEFSIQNDEIMVSGKSVKGGKR